MSLELIYTSVSRGLSPGSSGFCTAAATGGMSRQVVTRLEALSGYQFHFNLSDPRAAENPVNWVHTQVRIGAETLSVLSRTAFCGADYSGRTNKIAHHFLLEHGEQLPNGPAWMLMEMASRIFVAGYGGEPRSLPKRDLRTLLPADTRPPEPATTWESVTDDAGWAGMLVKAFRENPKVPAFVIFAPGQELLPLFEESLALLPPEERWQVGFATYYTALPAGCQYHWRGIIAGSSAAKEIQRFPNATVVDLTAAMGQAPDNIFTQAARTGTVLPPVRAPERPKIQIVERAAQPMPVAAEVAAEVEDLAFAMESGPRGPAVDVSGLAPSPAQMRSLIQRARRARWVWPLVAAVIVLVLSNAALLGLYVRICRISNSDRASTVPTEEVAQTSMQPPDKPLKASEDSKAPKAAPARSDEHESPGQKPGAGGTPAEGGPARKTGDTQDHHGPAGGKTQQQGETPQAHRAPPVSLPEPEKGWAYRATLPKARERAQVVAQKEGEVRFAVGAAVQFVLPPIRDERFTRSPDQPVNSVAITVKPPKGRPLEVRCSFEDSGDSRVLVWRFDPEAAKEVQAELDHLAIEVFDKTRQCVWLCEFKSPQPASCILGLGLGKPAPDEDVARVSIAHPWPETLRLRHIEGAVDKELSRDDSIQATSEPSKQRSSIALKCNTDAASFNIVAELQGLKAAREKLSQARMDIDTLKSGIHKAQEKKEEAERAIKEAEAKLSRMNSKEREAAEKNPENKKEATRLRSIRDGRTKDIERLSNQLHEKEGNILAAQDQARCLIADASKAFADCRLEVQDAYGRTVAIVRIEFSDSPAPAGPAPSGDTK